MTWSDKELENERPKTSWDISKSPVELLQSLRGIIKGSTTGDDEDSEALREAIYALELNAKLIRLALSLRAVVDRESSYIFHNRLVAGEHEEPTVVNDLMQAITLVGDDTWEQLKRNATKRQG